MSKVVVNNFILYFNAGSSEGIAALTIGAWGFGLSAVVVN